MSHRQHGHTRLTSATTRTWGKPPPSPFIVYSTPFHGAHIQMAFCPGTPEWEFQNRSKSNSMSHVVCTQMNQVDSRLFLIRSQIGSLTPDLSFGHNLCFRCPNEQCEPILNIYVLRAF
jgi:hypothetical protein